MDVNSPESAEWSRLMKITSEQEHKIGVLRDALEKAADHIKDLDGGDQSTESGWRSEESLDVWLEANRALAL
jgi:hypothetical protein